MNRYKFNDLLHCHSLDGKPLKGTSTVSKTAGSVPLYWSSGKALELFGWKPLNKTENGDKITKKSDLNIRMGECLGHSIKVFDDIKKLKYNEYFELLGKAYKNHATFTKEKAEEGTDAHELAEIWIKEFMKTETYDKTKYPVGLESFCEWSFKNVKKWLWSELHCYSEKLWCGGIIDAGFEHKDGRICLADFKNRECVRYTDLVQTGGYSLQLEENMAGYDKDGNNIFDLPKQIDSVFIFPLKKISALVERHDVEELKKDYISADRIYSRNLELKDYL